MQASSERGVARQERQAAGAGGGVLAGGSCCGATSAAAFCSMAAIAGAPFAVGFGAGEPRRSGARL